MKPNASGVSETVYTALLGKQISDPLHSRIINGLYKKNKLNYVYELLDVGIDDMPSVADALKMMGFKGFNVTNPGKNLMAYLADELSTEAAYTNSVNTVLIDDDRFIGYNTEGNGFLKALVRSGCSVKKASITIIGCGNAARAVMVKCAMAGFAKIDLLIRPHSKNRKQSEKTAGMIEASCSCRVHFYDYTDGTSLPYLIRQNDVLLNATNIGESEEKNESPVWDPGMLRIGLTVADMVAYPPKTKLLTDAKEAGCRCISGLDMLLYQSSDSFRIWTGRSAREADLLSLYPLLY